jgi:GT2 family glycosyltransferase
VHKKDPQLLSPTFTESGALPTAPSAGIADAVQRVRVAGKFLFPGPEKHVARGVTYGTFAGAEGFPAADVVASDFKAMVATGVNSVRTYVVPPLWLLELAEHHGLLVLVGIPWEQHLTFLDQPSRRRSVEQQVREAVRSCRGSRAVLGYVIGNEIPPSIVRWHGRQRVERFLERIYRAAKDEDPEAIVTYANYPSTEYLHLPFLDIVCFNVFLEEREPFAAYLARLQAIAGDRPLIISELGLDSRRHGSPAQADALAWQIASAFEAGCAGCFVFAWTDEWNRAGLEVEDWDFGLVDRAREPKLALDAVRCAYTAQPSLDGSGLPRVSVVVCTYNGAETIGGAIDALTRLDYPDYETIVVDDGSTDGAGAVAEARGARVVRTANLGLSAARNTGIATSDGEIVAFCDDDCRPDRDWLRYLVRTLQRGPYAGIGGPNVPPPGRLVAESIGYAPGRPTHVLTSPTMAEHIPGCNMAFRRTALESVGGFDPQFRVAGDDVDICWRIQETGGTLGFSPGAMVWHRTRSTLRGYASQQRGYGRAEALLERKWPERYNGTGHVDWGEAACGGSPRRSFRRRRWRVYYGRTGSGAFQSVYSRDGGAGGAFPLAPEWYLVVAALAVVSLFDVVGQQVLAHVPLLGVPVSLLLLAGCLALMAAQAGLWTLSVVLPASLPRGRRARLRAVIFWLCLVQPLARMYGRTRQGLTPWRLRGPRTVAVPRPRVISVWSESRLAPEAWVERLVVGLGRSGAQVAHGTDFDTWDVQVRVGPLAAARVRLGVEEHGRGRQMLRFRIWPRLSAAAVFSVAILATIGAYALANGAAISGALLATVAAWLLVRMSVQAGASARLPALSVRELGAWSDV